MRSMIVFGVIFAIAAPAAAQTPAPKPQPEAQQPVVLAKLEPGLVVKDTTGVLIGEVAEVKPVEGGRQIVMIKMDDLVFAFDGANLSYDAEAAYTNATRFALRAGLRATQASAPQPSAAN
jgi:hypothetical protein